MENGEGKLKIPDGFRNLLECLTLEILREQPANITKFAADYLKGRLKAREENGYDECLLGSQIDGHYKYEPFTPEKNTEATSNGQPLIPSNDRHGAPSNEIPGNVHQNVPSNEIPGVPSNKDAPSNELSEVPDTNKSHRIIHYDDKDLAAAKIQAGFHGYKCRQQIKEQNQAAVTIQAGYRGYMCRNDLDHKHEAATKIQAEFRGYQVRKEIGKNISKKDNDSEVAPSQSAEHQKKSVPSFSSRDDAATTIQAGYRGYRDRKEISNKGEAATTIQAGYRGYQVRKLRRDQSAAALTIQKHYRGYRIRKIRRAQSEAAITIQSNYRMYRIRKDLKQTDLKQTEGKPPSLAERNDLLEVLQQDSRSSFSLPVEDVKFEGDLDSDSDIDIDKVVDEMEAKQKASRENQEKQV